MGLLQQYAIPLTAILATLVIVQITWACNLKNVRRMHKEEGGHEARPEPTEKEKCAPRRALSWRSTACVHLGKVEVGRRALSSSGPSSETLS